MRTKITGKRKRASQLRNEDKERRFIVEYMKDLSSGKAAVRCGYNACVGFSLTKKYDKEIRAAMDERAGRIEISADKVLQEIAKLATVNVRDLYDREGRLIPIQELPRHVTASISKIKVKMEKDREDADGNAQWAEIREISFWDKKGSIELLMRHLNILGVEKKEITGKDGAPLISPAKDCKLGEYSDEKIKALMILAGQEDPLANLIKE